jgi:hypothetical protein
MSASEASEISLDFSAGFRSTESPPGGKVIKLFLPSLTLPADKLVLTAWQALAD